VLFLGSSEAIDESSRIFRPLDKKNRIYAPLPSPRMGVPVPLGDGTLMRTLLAHEHSQHTTVVHGKRFVQQAALPFQGKLGRDLDRLALSELHFKLIERFAPPSVIVDAEHEIVHLSEHAGTFLKFTGGEPTANVLRVVHPALQPELRAALFRAAESHELVSI